VLESALHAGHIERRIAPEAVVAMPGARGERPGVGARLAEVMGERHLPLYLFGAGHVGQAVARHARHLPLRLGWFDTRPVFAAVEGVTIVPADSVTQCVAEAPEDAAMVIMSHDHGLDYQLTLAALRRPVAGFVGLIGSATKRARFMAKLARDGVGEAGLARLTCPIGMAGVVGKEPDVIAIALLAQVLALRAPQGWPVAA